MTLEITLNTNQVKVSANKNIYLQNIKTDNIVTSIYKDTHDRKEIKLRLIYLLQCQFLRPFLHNQYTNHQCLTNAICQRHKPRVIGNLMQLSTKLAWRTFEGQDFLPPGKNMAKCWYKMFLCSELFMYTLITGNDILHKHFRMFVLLVVHDEDQTAVIICTEGTMNRVPDLQTLR